MATRTTETTNTLETFRVNFNGQVDDIGNVTVSSAGDHLNTTATSVVGAINEIFAGFRLSADVTTYSTATYLQSSNAETLNLNGGTGSYTGVNTTNIITDITADDTMSFYLNDKISITRIVPSTGTEIVFGTLTNGSGTNYNVKFASPGDTNVDYGSTQGFSAAMAVALG